MATSAYDTARAQLAEWGIGELADDIINLSKAGYGEAEFLLKLRETDSYKTRFAGNAARLANHQPVLSEKEYLDKEDSLREILSDPRYGLPPGMYDSPDDFAKIIGTNMGSREILSRLDAIQTVVTDGQLTGTLAYAQQKYGLTTGDLMAVWLDPDRAEAQIVARQARASAIGATAERTGFGDLSTADAERLDAIGVTSAQATQGFNAAARMKDLTTSVDGDEAITRDDLIRGQLEGNETADAKARRLRQSRAATFQGGGKFAESREGFAGLGDSVER